ncbi:MAG: hypothetical protein E6K21_00075 [Gammaproteobacteria bacterium]|nr:MAG: hypothetical protein E6K21_00075 [Gammaproteobacteria bacterium]
MRRLRAIRDTEGLRVLVLLEPALDRSAIHPAWMANRDVRIDELRRLTGDAVRLEHVDESLAAGVESDARGAIVAALSWRDSCVF